jgi:hypothetical protein
MTSKVVEDASGADDSPGVVSRAAARLPSALLWALLELFVITGFVVAQPLLDVTGKAPDFFLLHRADRGEILALIALILVAPALVLWVIEVAASLVGRERARRVVHLAVLAGLFAVLALEAGKKLTPLRGKRLALAALIAGIAVAALYHKWSGLKLWLRYLAPAPLVFALLFATTSPSAKLILPSHDDKVAVAARVDPGKPLPPVVMVFFDEFPLNSLLDSKGQVDPAVYPNFTKFAGDATWYRNATGIAGFTPTAVPAMLSGRYPTRNLVGAAPVSQVYPDNLFTMFGHYYNLKVSETVTQLCPPARCGQTGSPSGFKDVAKETAKLYKDIASPIDVPVDPATIDQNPSGGTTTSTKDPRALFSNLGQDQAARFEKFLGQINAGDPQPTLYFLHVLMPHAPWKRLPDGRIYGDPVGRPVTASGLWPDAVTKLNHERHLMQLAYTDTLVGKLLDRLRSQGLYDKALVLMTADHGSGFSAAARSRSLGGGDAPTLVWVPVFIKPPNQTKGRVDDRNWEQVDLLPTVADIVGLRIPWKVDGFSELGEPKRTRTEKWWYEQPGDRRVVPGPENFEKVLQGVTDTLTRAHQNGDRGLYQFGDTADWVYKSPQEVGQVEDGDGSVTAEMKSWAQFRTVKPGSNPVQSIVAGQVTSGTPPAGSTMVVVINGKVAGTGGFYPPHEGEKPTAFAAMVPDFLFTAGPGQRQIQIYLARRTGGTVTFQPVALSS